MEINKIKCNNTNNKSINGTINNNDNNTNDKNINGTINNNDNNTNDNSINGTINNYDNNINDNNISDNNNGKSSTFTSFRGGTLLRWNKSKKRVFAKGGKREKRK